MPRSLWWRSTRKPGSNVRWCHVGALLVQHLGSCKAAGQHIQSCIQVNPVGRQEDDGFGESLDVCGDDELVGGLHRLTSASRSHMNNGSADRVEDVGGCVEISAVPSDHDGERRRLCPRLAAGYGRIQQPQSSSPSCSGELNASVRADAGEVDDERPRGRVLEDAVFAGEDGVDVRCVRDHECHNVGGAHRVGDGVRHRTPRVEQALSLPRTSVVSDHVVTRALHVDRHGTAHDSETYEGNGRHVSSAVGRVWRLQARWLGGPMTGHCGGKTSTERNDASVLWK